MKHLLTTALLCGASILGAHAQNVIITDKDGVQHKFNADYVQEITFEQVQSGDGYDFKFDAISLEIWAHNNLNLLFTSGDNSVDLEIIQPDALYLQPGTYEVSTSQKEFSIVPGAYTKINVNGNAEVLKGGEMTVDLTDNTYNFELNLSLESGKELKGTFSGELPVFGPTLNYVLTGCAYQSVNDPEENGFYYKFNDTNWKIEMRIDLFSAGETPKAGVYTFSKSTEDNSASSYVNLYSPYNEATEFEEGTVTISGEGKNTVVEIEGKLALGLKMTAKFTGALPEREEPDL